MKTIKIKGVTDSQPVGIMSKLPKLSQHVIIGKFTTFGGYRDLRSL